MGTPARTRATRPASSGSAPRNTCKLSNRSGRPKTSPRAQSALYSSGVTGACRSRLGTGTGASALPAEDDERHNCNDCSGQNDPPEAAQYCNNGLNGKRS